MKVAYLVWQDSDDDYPILVPEGDSKLDWCWKKIRIAYSEIIED